MVQHDEHPFADLTGPPVDGLRRRRQGVKEDVDLSKGLLQVRMEQLAVRTYCQQPPQQLAVLSEPQASYSLSQEDAVVNAEVQRGFDALLAHELGEDLPDLLGLVGRCGLPLCHIAAFGRDFVPLDAKCPPHLQTLRLEPKWLRMMEVMAYDNDTSGKEGTDGPWQ